MTTDPVCDLQKGKLIDDCVIDETGESAYDVCFPIRFMPVSEFLGTHAAAQSSGNVISMSAAQAQDGASKKIEYRVRLLTSKPPSHQSVEVPITGEAGPTSYG